MLDLRENISFHLGRRKCDIKYSIDFHMFGPLQKLLVVEVDLSSNPRASENGALIPARPSSKLTPSASDVHCSHLDVSARCRISNSPLTDGTMRREVSRLSLQS